MPIYATDDGLTRHQQGTTPTPEGAGNIVDYEYVKCGYGKLVWPDESNFEGYWINNEPCGVGVFRSGSLVYEGFWAKDRQTNLSVFRQNVGSDIENDLDSIERFSDLTSL